MTARLPVSLLGKLLQGDAASGPIRLTTASIWCGGTRMRAMRRALTSALDLSLRAQPACDPIMEQKIDRLMPA